ncbi:hypothetical protein [Stenotrophomonas sp.]|uniref:hypothetical protein n=1 Tax=Stenotrophomonas sp. TaxID=69392 RepID=UPI0028A8C906|nr:hypothetical protein [Stenotrophomonas sp.]
MTATNTFLEGFLGPPSNGGKSVPQKPSAGSRVDAEPASSGTDSDIKLEVRTMILSVTSTALPEERATFDVEVNDGIVRFIGSTDSVMLYKRLAQLVPECRAIHGVRGVDISGVAKP